MADATDFAKMVPGFDFLQGLMKNAGSALPNMGQWIAPTLNPEELEKRIEELRTVQFWLEQNARMLAATIQALEVQRMTLSTLKTMNLTVGDIAEAFTLKTSAAAPAASPAPAPAVARKPPRKAAPQSAAPAGAAPATGVVDPMQWWNALTQQFTQLAASALKEDSANGAKRPGGGLAKDANAGSAPMSKDSVAKPAKAAPGSGARTGRARKSR